MDKNPHMTNNTLQILVLDEADQIFEKPSSHALSIILKRLEESRQKLLFSATKIKNSSLVRLHAYNPRCFFAQADSIYNTPLQLQQVYLVCELREKLDILWSFLNTHKKNKSIVFLSTCKQVDFISEVSQNLQIGIPIRCLHGKMTPKKKIKIIARFLLF